MIYRFAVMEDLDRLTELANQAIAGFRERGINQWQKGEPNREGLQAGIDHGDIHVIEDEGRVIAMITVVPGPELSYEKIEGEWLNEEPYYAFHRVCVDEACKGRGIAGKLFAFSEEYVRSLGCRNVRIDTHPENFSMQRALFKNGFLKCGELILADGSEKGDLRWGYHKRLHRIVVLDGYSVNPGDITWNQIQTMGQVTVYDATAPGETVEHIGDADIVLTNKTEITKEILDACPGIRYIGVLATGYNVIDLEAARERGTPVTNVPAYSTTTVAQFTFALILELCHHIGMHDASVKRGDWVRSTGFCYWMTPMIELAGKTLGIIGFGQIGRAVAAIAPAFGLKVLVYTPHPKREYESESLHFVSLDEVLEQSDIVTLHCLLNEQTRGMINRDALMKMKTGAMLINVSRGPLVEEQDLKDALVSGHLAGAACDVVSVEPMKADNPLLDAPNIILTPHMAWASVAARERLLDTAAENIRKWQAGDPQNVVS